MFFEDRQLLLEVKEMVDDLESQMSEYCKINIQDDRYYMMLSILTVIKCKFNDLYNEIPFYCKPLPSIPEDRELMENDELMFKMS